MNYTSVEESQKLVDLGLDINSADMNYYHDRTDDVYVTVPLVGKSFDADDLPCWSLGALTDLLKERNMQVDEDYYGTYTCIAQHTPIRALANNLITEGDTMFEAVYKMIVKLLIGGHLVTNSKQTIYENN